MALTKRFCQTVAVPGRYMDARGDGLFLNVAKGGSKSWIQRITIKGKRCDLGLGGYRFVSLAEAREVAFENQKVARRGGDPRAGRRTIPTFGEGVEAVVALHAAGWRGDRAAQKWRATMRDHAGPLLGQRLDTITAADVLAVLSPIWSEKRRTARGLRTNIATVLKWSVAQGFRADDPMPAVTAALPRNGSETVHHRTVSHGELAGALAQLRAVSSVWAPARLCIELVALTAIRSGEARGAMWREIDFEARLWSIPASRTKSGRAHRVPLSDRAVAVLHEAETLADASGRIFSSTRGGVMPDNALWRALSKAGLTDTMTTHGLRSSFRDWCGETGKPRDISEAALGHVVGGVEAAYFRSDLLERRRDLMQQWSSYICENRG